MIQLTINRKVLLAIKDSDQSADFMDLTLKLQNQLLSSTTFLSASLKKRGVLPETSSVYPFSYTDKQAQPSQDIQLLAIAKDGKNQLWKEQRVMAYSPSEHKIYHALTDSLGRLTLYLKPFHGDRLFRFYSKELQPLQVELETTLVKQETRKPLLSAAISEALQELKQRRIIYQLYNQLPQRLVVNNEMEKIKLPEAARTYIPQDYEEFETFKGFFREVDTHLKVQVKDKKIYRIRVFDASSGIRDYYKKPALIILNGRLVDDITIFENLDWRSVESVSTYHDHDQLIDFFGYVAAGRGVIIIETLERKKASNALDKNSLIVKGLLPEFTYLNQGNEKVPKVNPQLAWFSKAEVHEDGKVTLKLERPLLGGSYQLEAVAIDGQGKPTFIQETIEINP